MEAGGGGGGGGLKRRGLGGITGINTDLLGTGMGVIHTC